MTNQMWLKIYWITRLSFPELKKQTLKFSRMKIVIVKSLRIFFFFLCNYKLNDHVQRIKQLRNHMYVNLHRYHILDNISIRNYLMTWPLFLFSLSCISSSTLPKQLLSKLSAFLNWPRSISILEMRSLYWILRFTKSGFMDFSSLPKSCSRRRKSLKTSDILHLYLKLIKEEN